MCLKFCVLCLKIFTRMARNCTKSSEIHFCVDSGDNEDLQSSRRIGFLVSVFCFLGIYKLHFGPKLLMLFAFIVVTFVIATKVTKKASQKNPSPRRATAGPVF